MTRRYKIKDRGAEGLTIFVGICAQNTVLMAQHVKFHLNIGSIFLRKESSQLGLNLRLLVE